MGMRLFTVLDHRQVLFLVRIKMHLFAENRLLTLFVCYAVLLIIEVSGQWSPSTSSVHYNTTRIFGQFVDIISRLEAKVTRLETEKEIFTSELQQCETIQDAAREGKHALYIIIPICLNVCFQKLPLLCSACLRMSEAQVN